MLAKRIMGKAAFTQIQDQSGRIQLFLQQSTLGDIYEAFKGFDVGDIVGAEGQVMRTKTGELSIKVESLRLLTKSLRPLPDKWHGLENVEQRYRQRYVDLIVNEDSRRVFALRSRAIRAIRDFMEGRGFVEVETPMMHPIPGGATARPFVTHHNALDLQMYLRVAPELYLKRLVVGGLDRVFEINRNFRNEGVSTRHNPEFTMLESYEAYATFNEVMDMTEAMIRTAAQAGAGTTQLAWEGRAIDVGPAFARTRMDDAVLAANPEIRREQLRDREVMAAHAARLGIHVKKDYGWGKILLEIFEKTV
jgi:lysyl-tRNA synthetase class 2